MADFLRWAQDGRTASEPAAAGSSAAPEPTPLAAATVQAAVDSPPRPSIFGRVTRGGDSPLAGAMVTLTDLAGKQLDRDRADSGGHYRLNPPTGGSYLVICASAAHQPTATLVAVARVPVRHDVAFGGADASLSGTVCLAESGQPLADAVVTLIDIHGAVVGAASTDPVGRFSFVELTQGRYTLTVTAESLQLVTQEVGIPAEGHATVEVAVATRVRLAGVVRTATAGVPVPEALATLIAADGQVVGSVITDAEGGFAFGDLAAGVYTLVATGYPPVAAEVNLRMGAPAETVITLSPPTLEPPSAASDNTGREDSEDVP